MSTRRTAKVAEAIREVVSSSILFELRDPRVQHVTVLGVEVHGDMRSAKVFVSIMGTEQEQKLCLHGLNSSRGFLQKRIADKLDLRYTPILDFVLDEGVKKSIEASRILRELAEQREASQPPDDSEGPSGESPAIDPDK
jgi:ribosome-binding factor A